MFTKPFFAVRYFNGFYFTPNVGAKMPWGSAANRLYQQLNPMDYRSVDWDKQSIKISQKTNYVQPPEIEGTAQAAALLQTPEQRTFSSIKIVPNVKTHNPSKSYLLTGLGNQFLVNGSDIRKEINSL